MNRRKDNETPVRKPNIAVARYSLYVLLWKIKSNILVERKIYLINKNYRINKKKTEQNM